MKQLVFVDLWWLAKSLMNYSHFPTKPWPLQSLWLTLDIFWPVLPIHSQNYASQSHDTVTPFWCELSQNPKSLKILLFLNNSMADFCVPRGIFSAHRAGIVCPISSQSGEGWEEYNQLFFCNLTIFFLCHHLIFLWKPCHITSIHLAKFYVYRLFCIKAIQATMANNNNNPAWSQ